MKKETISYIWAILAMASITVFFWIKYVARLGWIFLSLLFFSPLDAQIPKGTYYVTESTHSWFTPDYVETVVDGYMNEKTEDHYGVDDWYYELRYKDNFKIVTLRMSNSDCTEAMEMVYEATYAVNGDKVTINFTNGQKMVMSKKRKNTAE